MSSASYNSCRQSRIHGMYTIILFQCIFCNTLQSFTPATKSSENKLLSFPLHQRWYEYWTSTCWQLKFCLLLCYDFCNFLSCKISSSSCLILAKMSSFVNFKLWHEICLRKVSFLPDRQILFSHFFSRTIEVKKRKSPKMCYAYQSINFQCQNGSDKKWEEYLGGIVTDWGWPKTEQQPCKRVGKSDSGCQMQCNSSVTRKAGEILVASFQPELETKSKTKTKPDTKTKRLNKGW